MTDEDATMPTNVQFELVFDIAEDNLEAPEVQPHKSGVLILLVPGVEAESRMVVKSGLPITQVERILMNALSGIDVSWRDGSMEEAGELLSTRDERMTLKAWTPWQ